MRGINMVEEGVGVKWISLHGYMKNTSTDRAVFTEHRLIVIRSLWPLERNIRIQAWLDWMKERRRRRRASRAGGEGSWSKGETPTSREISLDRREAFEAVKGEWSSWSVSEWSENHTVSAVALHTSDWDECPLLPAGVGIWNVGTGEQSQGKDCCWLQGDGWGNESEEIHNKKCLWEKTEWVWEQDITFKSHAGVKGPLEPLSHHLPLLAAVP